MLSTILRSTNSGRTGFYEIGKVIESVGFGVHYKKRI